MSWETFVLITYLKTAVFCQPLLKPNEPVCPYQHPYIETPYCECLGEITECVFDGEKFNWCVEDYKERNLGRDN